MLRYLMVLALGLTLVGTSVPAAEKPDLPLVFFVLYCVPSTAKGISLDACVGQ